MRTKRSSKDVIAREKAGVRLFRECALKNANNARKGSTNCCAIGGLNLRFQECSSLSRMLYQNLTALRTMEDDKDGKKYNAFVKWNLSDNQMQKLWNFGQSRGKKVFIQLMWFIVVRALSLDVLASVASSFEFDLKEQVYIKRLIQAYHDAGGKVTEKIQGAINTLFGKKHDEGTTLQQLLEAGMTLGQNFGSKMQELVGLSSEPECHTQWCTAAMEIKINDFDP